MRSTSGMTQKPLTGFTLIEVLIYASLLAVMCWVVVVFATRVIQRNADTRLTTATLDNARAALALMTHEIRTATGVYTPTSVFDTHPGQLSVATIENLPTDENTTYVDFYLDDERLYRKRENQAAELITSENVRITNLTFTHLHETSVAPTIKINLTVVPAEASNGGTAVSTVTLTTSASLRSY